jgi:hypothetical protein
MRTEVSRVASHAGTASPDADWQRLLRRAGAVLLTLALVGGAAPRIWLALFDQGIFWPDEIYQSLEPAHRLVFGYGMRSWEFIEGARSWAFPGMLAAVLRACAALGIDSPENYLAVVRLLFAGIGVATAYGCYVLARACGASPLPAACAAALWALAAPAIYFAPRAMSETASALPVVFGFALAVRPRGRLGQQAAGAALLGLATAFRLQNALFCVGLLALLAARREWRQTAAATTALALCAVGYGLLDRLTWGGWFRSAELYLRFNLIEGQAAHWGVKPPWEYLRLLWTSMGGAGVLLVALTACAWTRARGLMFVTAGYLLVHALTPHKELRFILPALPLLCALAGVGIDGLADLPRLSAAGRRILPLSAALATVFAATIAAVRLPGLTFGDLGQYDQDPPGPNLYYKPHASAFDDGGPVNRLLLAAHHRPDLCGLKVETAPLTWTGGYTYLHRNVPLYPPWGPPSEAGFYNYQITAVQEVAAGEVVAVDGDQALVRVREGDCLPDPGYEPTVKSVPREGMDGV